MKLNKISSLFLLLACICCVLFSSCGTGAGMLSSSNAHTPTPTATKAKTASTTTATPLPADCPAAGTVRSVQLPPDTSPAQPAVFYLTFWGGVQSGLNPLDLKRYDLATGKTSTIFTFTGFAVGYRPEVHLSPNKHWLLVTSYIDDVNRVQLMDTNGTRIHTLACSPSSDSGLDSADWLPDGQQIALTSSRFDQQQRSYTVQVFNLATGELRTVLSGDYFPYAWLDDHRLIVEKVPGTYNSTVTFFIFDTNKGIIQKSSDLTRIASLSAESTFSYGDVTAGSDGSQLFISSFTRSRTNPANCQGSISEGPGTLYSYTINGGSTHTIYSSKNLAILKVQPINAGTLLIYVENTVDDLSQNGLWKINIDGTGLTRLTTAHDQKCSDLDYSIWLPQIASNSQFYALERTDFTKNENQSIVVGSLSGGAPTTIAASEDIKVPRLTPLLQLVGMA